MNIKADLKSWKTTLLGVVAGLMLLLPQVKAVLDDDPKTVIDYNIVVAALGTMGIGVAAKDGDKTSEDVGTN